jgi:hypothetical protein
VQGVTVRDNTIANGRLLFVSAHGGGDMSNFLIANNHLHNESIGIDMVSPSGIRRHNVVVTGNTSDLLAGNPRGAIIRFVDYDNVTVTNNREPGAWHRNMYMVGFQNTCYFTASGNDLGQYGAGDYVILANNYVCKPMAAGSTVYHPPSWFDGTDLGIDPGGPSTKGVVGCTDKAHCNNYLLNSPRFVSAPALTNSTDPRMLTMLEGEQHYQIPMRPGTYIVTVSWAEPRTDGSEHVFHLEIERQRVILHGENLVKAPRTLVTRSFRVTTADGALNLDFLVNPVVSYIDIRRA